MQETSNTQKDLIDWEATATFIQCNMHIHPLTAVTSWPLFPDSDIAKKMSCGHTKSACIVTNVLAPVSVEKCIRELTSPTLPGDKHKHTPFFLSGLRCIKSQQCQAFSIGIKISDSRAGVANKCAWLFMRIAMRHPNQSTIK